MEKATVALRLTRPLHAAAGFLPWTQNSEDVQVYGPDPSQLQMIELKTSQKLLKLFHKYTYHC